MRRAWTEWDNKVYFIIVPSWGNVGYNYMTKPYAYSYDLIFINVIKNYSLCINFRKQFIVLVVKYLIYSINTYHKRLLSVTMPDLNISTGWFEYLWQLTLNRSNYVTVQPQHSIYSSGYIYILL